MSKDILGDKEVSVSFNDRENTIVFSTQSGDIVVSEENAHIFLQYMKELNEILDELGSEDCERNTFERLYHLVALDIFDVLVGSKSQRHHKSNLVGSVYRGFTSVFDFTGHYVGNPVFPSSSINDETRPYFNRTPRFRDIWARTGRTFEKAVRKYSKACI